MLHPSTDNWIGGSHCTKQIGVPAKNVAGMAKKVRRSVVASEVSEGVKTLAFCGHVRKSRTRPLRKNGKASYTEQNFAPFSVKKQLKWSSLVQI